MKKLNPKHLREKLQKFECARCNNCCKQAGFVYLKEGEAEKIAEFLKLDIYEFTNRYCDIQERQNLVLKKLPDEACIFLTEEGCSVNPAKPEQCRDFPIKWRTAKSLSYCEGMKKLLA